MGLVYVAVLQLLLLTTILHELYFNVSYGFQAYLYGGFIFFLYLMEVCLKNMNGVGREQSKPKA
jgi:hypothetical protein